MDCFTFELHSVDSLSVDEIWTPNLSAKSFADLSTPFSDFTASSESEFLEDAAVELRVSFNAERQ